MWWLQAFEQAAVALGGKLEEGETFLGAPPPPLLLGLAHLTGACPPRIVAGSLPRLLRWLLAALEALATGPLQDAGALKAALSTVEHALDVDSGTSLRNEQPVSVYSHCSISQRIIASKSDSEVPRRQGAAPSPAAYARRGAAGGRAI